MKVLLPDSAEVRRPESASLALAQVEIPPLPATSAVLSKRFYFPELDAIRIFLFFGVWAYHALPLQDHYYVDHHIPQVLASLITTAIKACMCSLDVFFILSAFLITELLLQERGLRGAVDLKTFYVRRLLRIWPLYFFVIALAGFLSLFDRSQTVGWSYALSFLFFVGNWIMAIRGLPRATILVPLWSVSFEEQFYLLWPLVLRKSSGGDPPRARHLPPWASRQNVIASSGSLRMDACWTLLRLARSRTRAGWRHDRVSADVARRRRDLSLRLGSGSGWVSLPQEFPPRSLGQDFLWSLRVSSSGPSLLHLSFCWLSPCSRLDPLLAPLTGDHTAPCCRLLSMVGEPLSALEAKQVYVRSFRCPFSLSFLDPRHGTFLS